MNITEILDTIPLWGVFVVSLLGTFLSIELGVLAGKNRQGKLPREERIVTGPVVAASFSLLAFMMAMTFSAVDSRYSALKRIAIDEANAIGTAFLRADVLPEEDRAVVRRHLSDYLGLRIEALQSEDPGRIKRAIDGSEKLQSDLWSRATDIAEEHPTPISALFVQSLNEVIDIYSKRISLVIHYRLPGTIWTVLFGLAFLTMAMGGYDTGVSGSRRSVSIPLAGALAFSVVLTLTMALDRPHLNLSGATNAAMIDLQEDIRRSMQSPP